MKFDNVQIERNYEGNFFHERAKDDRFESTLTALVHYISFAIQQNYFTQSNRAWGKLSKAV